MSNKVRFKIKHLVYLFLFFVIFSVDCATETVILKNQEKALLFTQDLNFLTNSNGKIVEQKEIRIESNWSEKIEFYKVKYLSDGLKIVGFILKPKGEVSKFPVMIFNRGGNREFGKITTETLKYLSYLASNNYVVLASQYRGNDGGQGREEFGGKDINDVLNLIPLAKSLSFTDQNKIVMLGFSRGGMMTYLAIKHGAEIKAAAVVGGVTDLIQTYNEREEGMKIDEPYGLFAYIFYHNVIQDLVGMDKNEWKKRSAFYWPEKINVPILILHGEDDVIVKVSQAKKLSERLKESGNVHDLVIFPKGDHVLNTHLSERDRRILEWFDRYLQQ